MDLRGKLLESVRTGESADTPSFGLRIQKWIPRISRLRTRLILPHALLTVLSALVGVFIVTRLVTASINERFDNRLLEASRVAADGVVRQEKTHLENLRLLTFMDGIPGAVERKEASRLREQLWAVAINSQLEAVSAIDLDGHEIITIARDPETSGPIPSVGAADYSRVPSIAKVLEGATDEVGDKFAGLLETTLGRYLITSAPVFIPSGDMVGSMMVGTRLDSLLNTLKEQALADVFILDSSGSLVEMTLVEPEEGTNVLEVDPRQLGANPESESFSRSLFLYGRPYKAVYSPLTIRGEDVGILGVVLDSNYIVSTMATSRDTFSLVFALGTVGVIVIGYLLAQSIAEPILRLRGISQAVASGDLEQSSGFERSDEIGELADAFDTMTSRLRERTEEAARLFEETVERNKELAEINTRLQAAQAQLIQSEKLAAVGQLTAGIVHDVKNPLAVIKGLAEELSENSSDDEFAKDGLVTIRDSAAKANTIVSDLLKFARQSTPDMRSRDIREIIKSSLRLTEFLTRKGNVLVASNMPPDPVMVTFDAQQIEQVIINLITNAVQAMPDGGALTINLREGEGSVSIDVKDSGIGIEKDDLLKIFDPFFTTKPEGEGTGLGLSVSYGIVSRHSGRIEVESEPGKGSTFTMILPIEPAASSD